MYLNGPHLQSFGPRGQQLGEWYNPLTWFGSSSSKPATEELTVTPKGWAAPAGDVLTVTPKGWSSIPAAPTPSKSTGGFLENALTFLAGTATKILTPSQPQQPQVGAPYIPNSVAEYQPNVQYQIQTPNIVPSFLQDPKVLMIGGGLLLLLLLSGGGGSSSPSSSPTINIRAPSAPRSRRR